MEWEREAHAVVAEPTTPGRVHLSFDYRRLAAPQRTAGCADIVARVPAEQVKSQNAQCGRHPEHEIDACDVRVLVAPGGEQLAAVLRRDPILA
jgi:hypothetical protein